MVRISPHRIPTRKRRIIAYIIHYAIRIPHLIWRILTLRLWRERSFPAIVRKVLIIRADGLGDVVMSMPAISALHDLFPDAEFTLLAGAPSRALIPHLRSIERVIWLDLPWAQRGVKRIDWSELRRVLAEIRRADFDLVIDLRGDFRNILLSLFMGRGYRVGFGCSGCGYLLDREIPSGEDRHQVEHALDAARALGATAGEVRFDLAVFEEDRRSVDDRLADLGVEGNRFMVMHPGAQWAGRQWTVSGYAEIADRAIRVLDLPVVMTGIARESGLCRQVMERMDDNPIDLTDQISFGEFLALLSRAHLFFGVDSGPMHLAAALGVPTVVLFGTGDPHAIGPYGAGHVVVSEGHRFPCSPCAQDHCRCEGADCMAAISVDSVWKAIVSGRDCPTTDS